MLKITQLFLLVVLFFAISQSANAGVLIEPLIGYNFNSKLGIEGENSEDYKGSGGAFGGRLGYQYLGFQLGVDYLHSSLDMNDKDLKENVSLDEYGGFIGFEFPVFIRVYAGYIFSATGETEFDGGAAGKLDFELKSGSGSKFGVGFTGLPFLVINVEYRTGSFDEYKLGPTKVEDKIDYSSLLLSLSLPINL